MRDADHLDGRRADLVLFAHVVRRPEAQLDLAQAALLIAEPRYPGLDIPYYLGLLDKLGDEARRRLAGLDPQRDGAARARRLARLLFDEVGFQGNVEAYGDPRNSFLNEVLDRRLGIPITLSLVLMEVARRAGVACEGVGFPQHFLARMPGPSGPILVDAFAGRVLDEEGLRALNLRVFGRDALPEPRHLAPATKTQILVRMLTNLRVAYQRDGDREGLRAVLERLRIVRPEDPGVSQALAALRDREPPVGAN